MYPLQPLISSQVYFDIEIDGEEVGRLNFELFGKEAPKTINNFLAFCSGEFNNYMKYSNSQIYQIQPGLFFKGGDFISQNGTGAATVYDTTTIPHEKNKLKFVEPYLLAMSANSNGETGCNFFVTLDSLNPLNDSDHTIIGRLIKGRDVISLIEGTEDYRKIQSQINKNTSKEVNVKPKIFIKNSGVYKFEQTRTEMRRRSSAGEVDFMPEDFIENRKNKHK